MDAIEVLCGLFIFFLGSLKHHGIAQSTVESQKYFKKMYDHGKLMRVYSAKFIMLPRTLDHRET
jgi:hypothetical protein